MKKYIRLVMVMVLMLFVLTGCTNTKYDVKVKKNGKGKVEYKVEFDEGVLERDYDSTLAGIESFGFLDSLKQAVEKNGYTYENLTKKGAISGCKITKEFDDIAKDFKVENTVDTAYIIIKSADGTEINEKEIKKNPDLANATEIKVEKGFFVTKYSQSFIVDTNKGGDVINTITIKYHFPIGIAKSNADKGIFNLTWNIGKYQEKKIEYTFYAFNWPLIALIIIAIIIIICIIRKIIINKREKEEIIKTGKTRKGKKRI